MSTELTGIPNWRASGDWFELKDDLYWKSRRIHGGIRQVVR